MQARGVLACLAAVVAALLAFAGGAEAKPGYHVIRGDVADEMVLPRDNGYSLEVFNVGRKQVFLVARRGAEAAAYAAPGHASSRRLSANFGRFGRIDVRFHPARPARASRRRDHCHGRDPVEQAGTFTGTIRFHDPGVANVAPRRAFGLFTRSFRTVCKVRKPHRHPGSADQLEFEAKLLSARAQTGNRVVSFEAASLTLGGKGGLELTFVGGGLREDFGRVLVTRSTLELAEEGEVVFSRRGKHPERVTISAPSPFAGRATYLENPTGPPSWTGTLSVPLAGRGRVPLTGPGFHAHVCRARSFEAFFDCAPGSASSASALRFSSAAGGPRLLRPPGPAWRAALRSATLR
jgi:hypothetical protein